MLASIIEDNHKVKVLDVDMEDLSQEEFPKRLSDYKPEILGISVLREEYIQCRFIDAKITKQIRREILNRTCHSV